MLFHHSSHFLISYKLLVQMKTLLFNHLKGKIIIFSMALFVAFSFASCAKKIVFPVSTVLPAAEGVVKIKTDKNKNYALELTVRHIAGPERLTPGRKCYVVWMETSENGIKNLGQLRISKKLNGSLETISSFKPTTVFITAEDDASTATPGMDVVLKTNSFSVK